MPLSSLCIATVFVPKVKSGEWAGVPKVELGEQRVKVGLSLALVCVIRAIGEPEQMSYSNYMYK